MTDRLTPEDAVQFHNKLVSMWRTLGPEAVWNSFIYEDPELLAYTLMMHTGKAALQSPLE